MGLGADLQPLPAGGAVYTGGGATGGMFAHLSGTKVFISF